MGSHPPISAKGRRLGTILSSRRLTVFIAICAALPLAAGAVQALAVNGERGEAAVTDLLRPTQDFSRPEFGEDKPGGEATSRKSFDTANAFSNSSGNLSFDKELDFKVGNGIFKKIWVSAPASTEASDGLGPLFNARSCQGCHVKDGRGRPPLANWPEDEAISMFLRLSIPPQTEAQKAALAARRISVVPEPTYGTQLQNLSIQGHEAEGKMHIDYEDVPVTLAGGEVVHLRKPTYSVDHLGYGPLHPDTMLSPRIAPQMIGMGLLEAVPEEQILQYADPDDRDGDGISGRANRVWSQKLDQPALGRFGWKAGMPDVRQQVGSAFAGDIGISNAVVASAGGDCTPAQKRCLDAPNGNTDRYQGMEAGDQMLDLVTFYSQNLAVPPRRGHADADILAGKELFYASGCAACHRPKLVTGEAAGQPHLSGQLIWPYTDLLLHDMGEGLADSRPEGLANGQEWRTAPLWGIGLTKTVSDHTQLLHDGRARDVKEAILWHGGEAQAARDAFAGLSKEERDKLIAFVNSL